MFSGAKKGCDLAPDGFLIPLNFLQSVAKRKQKQKQKRRRPDEFESCKDGNIGDLCEIYTRTELLLVGHEDLVSDKKLHGCSVCAKEGPIGVCGCARFFCSVCVKKCFVCKRTLHVSGLSQADAEYIVTDTLREVLMQACTLAREKNPNKVLLGNLASRIVQAKFCLDLLNRM